MTYTRTTWVDGAAPYINDDNLNNIELGLVDHDDHVYDATRDDHTQYARADGTRAVTGLQTFNTGAAFKGHPWHDVRAYGAACDGVTDDYAADTIRRPGMT